MRGKRLQRLIQVIALLRGPTAYNARRLSEHFGTSRRNIYRDIAVLELAGVPVYVDSEYGDGGSYRIRQDYWFPNVGLTDQECLQLAVLTRAAESQSIPLLDDVASVRDKLLQTLSPKQSDLITSASELFDILGLQIADHSHCRKVMVALQTALLKRTQISGTYRTPHQKRATKVSLQPQRILLAGPAWYLAAHDNADGTVKLYRIARFKEVRLSTKSNTIATRASVREILGNAFICYRGDRDWHVRIKFFPEAAELVAESRWHATQSIKWQKDGSLIFEATVSGLEEIRWWVLSWGPRCKVLAPQELVDEILKLSRRNVAVYVRSSKAGDK